MTDSCFFMGCIDDPKSNKCPECGRHTGAKDAAKPDPRDAEITNLKEQLARAVELIEIYRKRGYSAIRSETELKNTLRMIGVAVDTAPTVDRLGISKMVRDALTKADGS